ncbi:MAG: hypothetical protein M3R04_06530 [bacterium]|nr:hypothetical protein [bacterium]
MNENKTVVGGKEEWDVSITRPRKNGNSMQVVIPASIGVVLQERGFYRAKLTITEEGLLICPYKASPIGKGGKTKRVELPNWGVTSTGLEEA